MQISSAERSKLYAKVSKQVQRMRSISSAERSKLYAKVSKQVQTMRSISFAERSKLYAKVSKQVQTMRSISSAERSKLYAKVVIFSDNTNFKPSFFVSNIELYNEKTTNAYLTGLPIRQEKDFTKVVDTKLRDFFDHAKIAEENLRNGENNAEEVRNSRRKSILDTAERVSKRYMSERVLSKVQGQKQPNMTYDIGDVSMDDVRYSVGKKRKEVMEQRLAKARPDLSDEEKSALFDYLDTLDDRKIENATFDWFAKGTIRIPEDMDKVRQAVDVAGKAKVDPAKYNSPMELLNENAEFKPTRRAINPDDVPTLTNKKDYGNGITVYDVEDSEDSRKNMRAIIDTHWGEDCNPWCLLAGDGKGNLTEKSGDHWEHYGAFGKKVAFKDGKLLAFFASDSGPLWWDRNDRSHEGIPVVRKMPNDELGRSATYEYKIPVEDIMGLDDMYALVDEDPIGYFDRDWKEKYGEAGWGEPHDIHKGNKKNGTYEEWWPNGQKREESHWKNGRKEGEYKLWWENGNIAEEAYYVNDHPEGVARKWHENGQLKREYCVKNGERVGLSQSFKEDGSPEMTSFVNKEGAWDGEAWEKQLFATVKEVREDGYKKFEVHYNERGGISTLIKYWNYENSFNYTRLWSDGGIKKAYKCENRGSYVDYPIDEAPQVFEDDLRDLLRYENEHRRPMPEVGTPMSIGEGSFGKIYDWSGRDQREAFDFLEKNKSGYLRGVFNRPEIGDIDLIWGDAPTIDKGKGLAHIKRKHIDENRDFSTMRDASETIIRLVNDTSITPYQHISEPDKWFIEKGNHRIVIAKDAIGNWVLTAYDKSKRNDKKRKGTPATITPSRSAETVGAGAVAPNLSDDKGSNNSETAKGNGEKDEGEESKQRLLRASVVPNQKTGVEHEDSGEARYSVRDNAENISEDGEKLLTSQREGENQPRIRGWEKRDVEINTSDYETTDEFRRVQEECRRRPEGVVRLLSGGGGHPINSGGYTREYLEGVVQRQLGRAGEAAGKIDGIVGTGVGTDTQYGIRKNVSGKLFHDIFEVVKSYLKGDELVDLHDNYDDCICYLSEDGTCGFAINQETGYFTSVFNLGVHKNFVGDVRGYLANQGATYGDCFAAQNRPLHYLYARKLGVQVVAMVDYNIDYDANGIAAKYNNPQIAFFCYLPEEEAQGIAVRHFDKDSYDEATELSDVADYLFGDDYAAVLTGNEFPKGANSLLKQVEDFYNERYGGSVFREGVGNVFLDKEGIQDSRYHYKRLTRKMAVGYAAVPEVIEKGRILSMQDNWKERGYDTTMISAPVKIGKGRYVETVVIITGSEKRAIRFYLHRVNAQKGLLIEAQKTPS